MRKFWLKTENTEGYFKIKQLDFKQYKDPQTQGLITKKKYIKLNVGC
jgi:hypothetical protein